MLGVISNLLTFMAAYTCLDSVIPDLDSLEVIPDSMKFVLDLEPKLLEEWNTLLLSPNSSSSRKEGWRLLSTQGIVRDKNFTLQWQFSKAYDRDIYKATTLFNFPKDTVVDSFWIEQFVADSWGDEMFSHSKILGYAGANRFIIWQQLDPPMPGWLMSTRDFVTYFTKFEFGLGGSNDESSKETLILASNVTSYPQWDYPPKYGVVRAIGGTSGWRITEVEDDPGVTKVEWIANADQKAPSIMPRSAMRPIMARIMSGVFGAWRKYMEKQHDLINSL